MNIDLTIYNKNIDSSDWKKTVHSRLAYWPKVLNFKDGWYEADTNSFTAMHPRNFWSISEQYYLLAWSLFTLGHPNQIMMPYRDNDDSEEAKAHQEELRNRISNKGSWGDVQITGQAHLACELAIKSILLHTCHEINKQPSFLKSHDLKKLLDALPDNVRGQIENEFNEWSDSGNLSLEEITAGSGKRFVLQRYGEFDAHGPKVWGVMTLSRFFHEVLINA